jgi:hypothetical protein
MFRRRDRCVRVAAATILALLPLAGCSADEKAPSMTAEHPSIDPVDRQKIEFIDSLRSKVSFESARDQLTALAQSVAEKISAAIPGGHPWRFDDRTSDLAKSLRDGASCDELPARTDIARKASAPPIIFATFTPEDFQIAKRVIREQAATLAATEESSLFNDASRAEYDVTGNGYEFRIMQSKKALFTLDGDCHLMQKVLDSPAGQLPKLGG